MGKINLSNFQLYISSNYTHLSILYSLSSTDSFFISAFITSKIWEKIVLHVYVYWIMLDILEQKESILTNGLDIES